MPYWIIETLAGTPAFLWVYIALGGVWALALLPREDWRRRVDVFALGFALGAALLTLWMFVLGTLGSVIGIPLLRFDLVFAGTLILFIIGAVISWRKRRPIANQPPTTATPLANDEKWLITLVIAALVVRWIVIAYWSFTAYDALWVYGYEARLYFLEGVIPATIDYYPQFVPLHYTFGQLAVGAINDHAARASIIFLHIGSILAAYTLGSRLFTRRTGIIAAVIWALYPQFGEWSRAGDLEIPLAFLFTLAAAFFLTAWTTNVHRRRYAIIAGIVFGIGMWTKPTMGAFVWGVALLLIVELIRVRGDWRAARTRIDVVFWTGLSSLPIGAVWYIRNMIYGHAAVDFPPAFWTSLAVRSITEFGWFFLALGLLALYLVTHRRDAIAFIHEKLGKCVLVLGVALPYFITYFMSYSYHYRLSFAVVPLLILPSAVVLSELFTTIHWRRAVRAAYLVGLLALAVPGIVSAIYDRNGGWDYLWTDKYPDDDARYRSGNAALMNLVEGLRIWKNDHPGETLIVSAPGIDRLPFFFPTDDIRVDDVPTTLNAVADAAYFVYGVPESMMKYRIADAEQNQLVGALARTDIMRRAWGLEDVDFRYNIYELNLNERFVDRQPVDPQESAVLVGDFARFLGIDLGGLEFWPGRPLYFTMYWQVIGQTEYDYSIFVHLRDRDGNLIANWDAPTAVSEITGIRTYYSTRFWETGEIVFDQRILRLPEGVAPVGSGYELIIGMYDSTTGVRVEMTVDGVVSENDEIVVENRLSILDREPGT